MTRRIAIISCVWASILVGMWWAYSGAEPPFTTNRADRLDVDVDGYIWGKDLTSPNFPLVIAKSPPEATVPDTPIVLAAAPPTIESIIIAREALMAQMDIDRLLIVLDLVKDGDVATPANYSAAKIDRMAGATAIKYVDPFLRVWCRMSDEEVDGLNNEQKALATLDKLKWFFLFAYKSEQADMKAAQAAAVDAATKEAKTDLGEDEYQPPTADAGGPYTGVAGESVSFDGSGSSDPDGSVASYSWDCGDSETETGATPSHTYASEGTYTVTLTVTDDRDLTATATTTATISAP